MTPGPPDREPVESESLERLAWRNPGILTFVIMAGCVVVAFFTLLDPPELQMARLIDWGAQVNGNIAAGEWWRLLTPAFVHGGWEHLLFNLYALFVVGCLVEQVLGHTRFFVIYVLAAIAGSLASFAVSNAVSMGASGAIFGLMGAALVGSRVTPAEWTVLSPKRYLGLATWAGYSLVNGFTTTGIDNAAHVGGLLGGVAAFGLLLVRPLRPVLLVACTLALAWSGSEVARSPKVTPFLAAFIRGEAAADRKDFAAAEREYGAAVPFVPALIERSRTRDQLGDFSGALSDADAALAELDRKPVRNTRSAPLALRAFDQNQPETRAYARLQRVVALYDMGRALDLIAAADEALVTHNEDVYVRVRLFRGRALARRGRDTEALADFQEVMTSKDAGMRDLGARAVEWERSYLGPARWQEILDSNAARLSKIFREAELDRLPEIVSCTSPYLGVAHAGGYVELHFVLDPQGQVDSATVRPGQVRVGGSPYAATGYILSCHYRPGLVHGLPVRTQWHQGLSSMPPVPDAKVP